MPSRTPGASGSLSRVKEKTATSKPSPRPRKRGKGLLDQGRTEKESTFGTLREWLLREKEAAQGTAKDQGGLGGGAGKDRR